MHEATMPLEPAARPHLLDKLPAPYRIPLLSVRTNSVAGDMRIAVRFGCVVSLAIAAFVAGCASASSSVETRTVTNRYVCDDGLHFTATFDQAAERAAIQLSTGATDSLKQEVAASGALYASQRHRLHTKGNEALLDTLSDGVTHRCAVPQE